MFDKWWEEYLSQGGKSHFNISADKESAKAAWDAAMVVSAKMFDELGDDEGLLPSPQESYNFKQAIGIY